MVLGYIVSRGDGFYPSIEKIAVDLSMDERRVRRLRSELRAAGLLYWHGRAGLAVDYRVNTPGHKTPGLLTPGSETPGLRAPGTPGLETPHRSKLSNKSKPSDDQQDIQTAEQAREDTMAKEFKGPDPKPVKPKKPRRSMQAAQAARPLDAWPDRPPPAVKPAQQSVADKAAEVRRLLEAKEAKR